MIGIYLQIISGIRTIFENNSVASKLSSIVGLEAREKFHRGGQMQHETKKVWKMLYNYSINEQLNSWKAT